MGEQHLTLFVKNGLSVLEQGQGDVFQRQTHHLFAVGVVAHKAHETGHRLHESVPGLPGQLVAVTGGTGGGVAHAAGGHQYGICPVFPARSAPHADAAQGRAGFFLFRMARIFRLVRFGLRFRRQFFQQQLFGPVVDDVRILRVAQQGLPDLLGLVRRREHPASALHLQLHTKALEQLHGLCGRECPQRREQKARVRAHMAQKLFRRAVVGHIAAALAGNQNFLRRFFHVLQHRHLMSLPDSGSRRHQSGGTCPHDQNPCHAFSSKVPVISSISYQNHLAKAMQCRRKPLDFPA